MTKNSIVLIVTCLLVIIHSLIFSMQDDSKKIAYLDTIKKNEIIVAKPLYVKFLQKNIVLINGSEGFVLYDCQNRKSILEKHRSDDKISIAVNGAKTKIVVSADFTITMYDATTGGIYWQQPYDILFSHLTYKDSDQSVYVNAIRTKSFSRYCDGIAQLDCIGGKCRGLIELSGIVANRIVCRPYLGNERNGSINSIIYPTKSQLYLFQRNNGLPLGKKFNDTNVVEAEYGPSGNIIAINYHDDSGCYIHVLDPFNPIGIVLNNRIKDKAQPHYTSIAFFSDQVLSLLASDNILEFWQIDHQEQRASTNFIKQIDFSPFDTLTPEQKVYKTIDFSPDKKHFIVGLDNKCVILPVPLEVYYGAQFINNAFTAYQALKHHLHMDLIQFIIFLLLNQNHKS